MKRSPKIHLVTYATLRFRHRQILLALSAKLNRVANTINLWTPKKVLAAGFAQRVKDIRLSERGSGFWAWKPFLISKMLERVPDGDIVFYCDVGRRYPFKLLDRSTEPFVRWMDEQKQDIVPGVAIPWYGPMSVWTKRDAFVLTAMDVPEVHQTAPIQASFSFWRANPKSRKFAGKWMDLCAQRQLISDDPSRCGVPEFPDFREHRHDQSLLTLCCIREGIRPLIIGQTMPEIDTQHPCEVSRLMSGAEVSQTSLAGWCLRTLVWPVEKTEVCFRRMGR